MDYAVSFGRLGKHARPAPGPAFRLALMGDFSGRAGEGIVETGDKLAARKPLKIDVDNFDQVLARLKPRVVVGLGDEGTITVPIGELDDFAPDQLVENLEIFEQLLDLRRNLQSKGGFDRAAKEVLSWAGETALPAVTKTHGSAVPTDRKLSDFSRLTGRPARNEAAADDLIRRLVGPFVQPARDARQDALVARVDEALSAAMRRVLHSPEFQTAEALWRSVDMLVRRIETDARMQIVLYDISAEELAADLAASDALEESAIYSLLVEQTVTDESQGAISVVAGLYQWELMPPHADLLGRMAQVCGAAGAPFLSGIGPDPLREKQADWHPLIQKAWAGLRALPASAYLALATPRFLLRLPYGKRTEPIDAFAFEEFTRQGGLSGMLWGNPAVLLALALCETWARDGKTMPLGSVAGIDDLPVYVYQDQDGDQLALPCTERLFTEKVATGVATLGVIPIISVRGRPEVRIGSFGAVGGKPIAGRWAPASIAADAPPPQPPAPPPPKAAPQSAPEPVAAAAPEAEEPPDLSELDALLAGLDATPDPAPEPAPEPAAETPAETAAAEDDLDALLASLNATPEPTADAAEDTEADLDALLASLK